MNQSTFMDRLLSFILFANAPVWLIDSLYCGFGLAIALLFCLRPAAMETSETVVTPAVTHFTGQLTALVFKQAGLAMRFARLSQAPDHAIAPTALSGKMSAPTNVSPDPDRAT